ncbi:MAG: hypothetical protein ABJG78_14500 [Cyclobacteriaceae bacterium]
MNLQNLPKLKIQILKSKLVVVLLALILGLGISTVHHLYHQNPQQANGLIDSAITACRSIF